MGAAANEATIRGIELPQARGAGGLTGGLGRDPVRLLVDDLRRAVQAIDRDIIQDRCKHLKHGLQMLQVLDRAAD